VAVAAASAVRAAAATAVRGRSVFTFSSDEEGRGGRAAVRSPPADVMNTTHGKD
jgi:hypothetical protein